MSTWTPSVGALADPFPVALSETAPKNLLEVAAAQGSFSVFCEAVDRAGLTEFLNGHGPFTAFIPIDAAFYALPRGLLDTLLLPQNTVRLAELIYGHVLAKRKAVADFARWDALKTVSGSNVAIQANNGHVAFGVGKVVLADIHSSNAVIHGIDQVNLPAR
ncbi:fasciclin domain-containing protein [Lysobacter sp. CA199]|uniref:fasciclin domain-containing protein n=1 Tax=Lysobacter sp. CA199 TaxID=3455608 RepID=UPI003F8D5052